MGHYYRSFELGPQPQLFDIIRDQDYQLDNVIALPRSVCEAVVDYLDWPREPGLHVLASRLDPSSASIIHRDYDRASDRNIHWALNVPVLNCDRTWMEWFTEGDLMPMPPVKDTGIFRGYEQVIDPSCAKLAETSEGQLTAYVASNLGWHRVVNQSDQVSWCVSVRYYPLSFKPFKQAVEDAPWLRNIVVKKGT